MFVQTRSGQHLENRKLGLKKIDHACVLFSVEKFFFCHPLANGNWLQWKSWESCRDAHYHNLVNIVPPSDLRQHTLPQHTGGKRTATCHRTAFEPCTIHLLACSGALGRWDTLPECYKRCCTHVYRYLMVSIYVGFWIYYIFQHVIYLDYLGLIYV